MRIANRQHGRVACRQLLAAGVARHQIQRWREDGRLHDVHDGVYAVGHMAASTDANYMAAVLAGGEGAILSHRAAAYKVGLLRGRPPRPEVTVPTPNGRRRRGIVIHRVKSLDRLDHVKVDRIAIATVPRILLDLAPTTAPIALTRLCHEAWVRHGTTPEMVEACIARNPRKPGARRLRLALGTDVILSHLESAFVKLLRRYRLPVPRTNVDRAGDKVDCHWQEHDLTVELVSFRYHATRHGFEQDVTRRRRSNHVAFSYGDVVDRGAATAAEIRRHLGL